MPGCYSKTGQNPLGDSPEFNDDSVVSQNYGLIGKALTTAVIGAGLYEFQLRGQDVFMKGTLGSMLGREPVYVVGAIAGASSSLLADWSGMYILPWAEERLDMKAPSAIAQSAMAAGMGKVLSMYLLDPRLTTGNGQQGLVRVFVMGSLLEMAGGVAWRNLVMPMLASGFNPFSMMGLSTVADTK